ncbi:hypothetical protein [Oceanospirillum sediminis]|uniref:Uncharacterized protein n=1 Tax=Oceanospirillum sediminis TaxID=2760088 RepID=A0A839IRX4_9GAMM|nr:hypothetical protein [Oceanospirillum sediminis]MBB1487420.1 hypothetical protein [Oceanospirillum sediminis]
MMTLQKFQQKRYVDEVVEMDKDSWWVYRRSVDFNGTTSPSARIVFFAKSKDAVESWLSAQQ